ncbi:hypothetical protein BRARA_B03653 [Brassica rapa]|uniref:Uncharacterized protein n=1 Tax=Brassica campestris TaxID=3711 RepID=A0A398AMZ8_BRACM|nr:hypothetical protein BRARA_B03653 [Brassica rapa]
MGSSSKEYNLSQPTFSGIRRAAPGPEPFFSVFFLSFAPLCSSTRVDILMSLDLILGGYGKDPLLTNHRSGARMRLGGGGREDGSAVAVVAIFPSDLLLEKALVTRKASCPWI